MLRTLMIRIPHQKNNQAPRRKEHTPTISSKGRMKLITPFALGSFSRTALEAVNNPNAASAQMINRVVMFRFLILKLKLF